MSPTSRRSVGIRAGALFLAVGAAVAAAFVMPFSLLGSSNLALGYAMVAVSLVILTGWVGQISLAQASFVGIGAFTTGVLVRSWGVSFPLTLPLAAGVASGAAALLGVVALRVRGLYLAVATLIFAWMVQEYLFNQPWMAGVGGSSTALQEPLGDPGAVPFLDFADRRTFYFILLAATFAVLVGAANLRDSKTGRAWFAVKGSEIAAASLGIDVTRSKLVAFAVSGFIAGAAGSLTMTHQQVATVSAFSIEQSLFFLSVAVVGGLTSLPGALAGGALFAGLEEMFFRVEAFQGFLLVVSASLLAAVLLFFPAGLAGIPGTLRSLTARIGQRGPVTRFRQEFRSFLPGGRRSLDVAGLLGNAESGGEEPAAEAEVVGSSRGLRSLLGALPLRRRAPRGTVPDALAASLGGDAYDDGWDQEWDEEWEDDWDGADEPAGLVYTPGTAQKLALPPRAQLTPVLTASDITVRFGGLVAVDDFNLEVREGEIVGLMGPNGAGKTTLFNAVSGLNEPTAGRVELYGTDVTPYPVHERARLGMGRTFQVIQLFADLSVFENLMVATHQRVPSGFFSHVLATRRAVEWEGAARDRVRQVVDLLGLGDVADRRVGDLPFGTLRLVELGRALVTGSPFVMLDEPASGLDNTETDRFTDLLLWVRERLGITMLLIEHDVRMVMNLADYIYVIDRGKQIAHGPPAEIQRDEAVIAAYLGQASSEEDGTATEPAADAKKDGKKDKPVRSGGTRAKSATTKNGSGSKSSTGKTASRGGSRQGTKNSRTTTKAGR